MKVRYFRDTDTLLIELVDAPSVETRELDEDTLLDIDAAGRLCAITVEHASKRADAPRLSYEVVTA